MLDSMGPFVFLVRPVGNLNKFKACDGTPSTPSPRPSRVRYAVERTLRSVEMVYIPRRDAPIPNVSAGYPGGGAGARLGGSRRSSATGGVLSQAAELGTQFPIQDIRRLYRTGRRAERD
jgi:hypothetical protein